MVATWRLNRSDANNFVWESCLGAGHFGKNDQCYWKGPRWLWTADHRQSSMGCVAGLLRTTPMNGAPVHLLSARGEVSGATGSPFRKRIQCHSGQWKRESAREV